jgi:hypothetical protein
MKWRGRERMQLFTLFVLFNDALSSSDYSVL